MNNNNELKKAVDELCESIEILAKNNSGLPDNIGDAIRFEIAKFLMYLSASDGTIQWEEASTINEICGLNIELTPSVLGDYIKENNIYSNDFESTVPTTFAAMVAIDNALAEQEIDISGSEIMLATYQLVGQALLESDSRIDDKEKKDYNIYINMLKKYREENYIRLKQIASGFVKEKGANEPSKKGVVAPRKG